MDVSKHSSINKETPQMARPRNQTNYPEYHPESGKRILTPPEPPVQTSEFMTAKGKNINILKDKKRRSIRISDLERKINEIKVLINIY